MMQIFQAQPTSLKGNVQCTNVYLFVDYPVCILFMNDHKLVVNNEKWGA